MPSASNILSSRRTAIHSSSGSPLAILVLPLTQNKHHLYLAVATDRTGFPPDCRGNRLVVTDWVAPPTCVAHLPAVHPVLAFALLPLSLPDNYEDFFSPKLDSLLFVSLHHSLFPQQVISEHLCSVSEILVCSHRKRPSVQSTEG